MRVPLSASDLKWIALRNPVCGRDSREKACRGGQLGDVTSLRLNIVVAARECGDRA